jgi:hypothetical protein
MYKPSTCRGAATASAASHCTLSDYVDAIRAAVDSAPEPPVLVVLAPPNSDLRPLQILGVRTSSSMMRPTSSATRVRAAIAVAADILRADERIRDKILRIVERGITEVMFWGNVGPFEADIRLSQVAHRPSDAARAFKAHASAFVVDPRYRRVP